MTKDDGGFVYARSQTEAKAHYGGQNGITRRDECADKMAAGIWANGEQLDFLMQAFNGDTALVIKKISEMSYAQADAMIAEGRKEGE